VHKYVKSFKLGNRCLTKMSANCVIANHQQKPASAMFLSVRNVSAAPSTVYFKCVRLDYLLDKDEKIPLLPLSQVLVPSLF